MRCPNNARPGSFQASKTNKLVVRLPLHVQMYSAGISRHGCKKMACSRIYLWQQFRSLMNIALSTLEPQDRSYPATGFTSLQRSPSDANHHCRPAARLFEGSSRAPERYLNKCAIRTDCGARNMLAKVALPARLLSRLHIVYCALKNAQGQHPRRWHV